MSDSGKKKDSAPDATEADGLSVVLEEPAKVEMPSTQLGTALFGADSLAVSVCKVNALEAFLSACTRDLKFSDFMREILMAIARSVPSEAGSIFELDPSKKILFFRSVIGQSSDRLQHFEVPVGQGIVGHVAESRQPLVVDNVAENKLHLKSIQKAVGFETRNLIAVPLVIRGNLFGVLELLNRIGEDTYSAADIELLAYLADMASKAIETRLMLAYSEKKRSAA